MISTVDPFFPANDVVAELVRLIFKRFGPPPEPLAMRAQEVSDALTRATALFEELQSEIAARTALIDSLAEKTKEAEGRAENAIRRADLSEDQAKAVDAYLAKALKAELGRVERKSRRREWGLGIIGGLVVGVAAILIAHYLFGF